MTPDEEVETLALTLRLEGPQVEALRFVQQYLPSNSQAGSVIRLLVEVGPTLGMAKDTWLVYRGTSGAAATLFPSDLVMGPFSPVDALRHAQALEKKGFTVTARGSA